MNEQEKQQDPYEPPEAPPLEGRKPSLILRAFSHLFAVLATFAVWVLTCAGGLAASAESGSDGTFFLTLIASPLLSIWFWLLIQKRI